MVDQRLPVFFHFDAISSTGESIKTVPIIEKIQLMFQLPEKWSDNSDIYIVDRLFETTKVYL